MILPTDIADIPTYSGKPVVTLTGTSRQGRYVGIKVLKHSEPILPLGIPGSAPLSSSKQYVGRSVEDKVEVGQSWPDKGVFDVDVISGTTMVAIAQNQVLTTATPSVTRQIGILAPTCHRPACYMQIG